MNGKLYGGAKGANIDAPEKVAAFIENEGGKIVDRRVIPLMTGDAVQFHVETAGELWFLVPNRTHGYGWQRIGKVA